MFFGIINPRLKGDDYKSSPATANFWPYLKELGKRFSIFIASVTLPAFASADSMATGLKTKQSVKRKTDNL